MRQGLDLYSWPLDLQSDTLPIVLWSPAVNLKKVSFLQQTKDINIITFPPSQLLLSVSHSWKSVPYPVNVSQPPTDQTHAGAD